MISRRTFLGKFLQLVALGTYPIHALFNRVYADSDPRPEFAAQSIDEVLGYYFGTTEVADDGSIEIIVPITTERNHLVPFKIIAPKAEKVAILTDANPEPMIMGMDQIKQSPMVLIGRARFSRSGLLYCYVMRNGILGRASRRVTVSGHWYELS